MNGRTIVVGEDQPEVLMMVQTVLDDEGYDVVGVNHPRVIDSLFGCVTRQVGA